MSGNKIFLDTNILLYILNGDEALKEKINNNLFYISFITELELLSYDKLTSGQHLKVEKLLSLCRVVNYNDIIKHFCIDYRKELKLKLPDAVIAASAKYLELPLFTADKSFSKIKDNDIYIYQP